MIEESIGFFDESGTHANAKVLAVGGWVASVEEWEKVHDRWEAALKSAGVNTFHFADCDNGHGEFGGWSAWRKANLIEELCKIICRHDLIGVTGAILMPDYKDIVDGSGSVLEKKHSPFVLCQHFCIEMICKRIPEKVFYVFEDQPEFRSFAVKEYWDTKDKMPDWALKMSGIAFRPKTEWAGLQAADLLVYESAKSLRNRKYEPDRPMRKSLRALIKCKGKERLIGGFFDANGVKTILEWNPPKDGAL